MKCNNCKANGVCEAIVGDCDKTNEIANRFYQQGRADAIEEYKKKIEFEYKWLLGKPVEPNVGIAFKTLISYAEQLKEQKNE